MKKKVLYLLLILFAIALITFLIIKYTELFGFAVLENIEITRIIQDKAIQGEQVPVILKIDVDDSSPPNSIIIKEILPSTWNIQGSYLKKEELGQETAYSWFFYAEEVKDKEIVYTIVPDVSGIVGGKLLTFNRETEIENSFLEIVES